MPDAIKQLNVRIQASTHKAAKITAAAYDMWLGDVVDRLLRLWIADPSIIDTDIPEPPDEDPQEMLERLIDQASGRR